MRERLADGELPLVRFALTDHLPVDDDSAHELVDLGQDLIRRDDLGRDAIGKALGVLRAETAISPSSGAGQKPDTKKNTSHASRMGKRGREGSPRHLLHLSVPGREIVEHTEPSNRPLRLLGSGAEQLPAQDDAQLQLHVQILGIGGAVHRRAVGAEGEVVRLVEDGLPVPDGRGPEERQLAAQGQQRVEPREAVRRPAVERRDAHGGAVVVGPEEHEVPVGARLQGQAAPERVPGVRRARLQDRQEELRRGCGCSGRRGRCVAVELSDLVVDAVELHFFFLSLGGKRCGATIALYTNGALSSVPAEGFRGAGVFEVWVHAMVVVLYVRLVSAGGSGCLLCSGAALGVPLRLLV